MKKILISVLNFHCNILCTFSRVQLKIRHSRDTMLYQRKARQTIDKKKRLVENPSNEDIQRKNRKGQ